MHSGLEFGLFKIRYDDRKLPLSILFFATNLFEDFKFNESKMEADN